MTPKLNRKNNVSTTSNTKKNVVKKRQFPTDKTKSALKTIKQRVADKRSLINKRLEFEAVSYLNSALDEDSSIGDGHLIADPDLEDMLVNAKLEIRTFVKHNYGTLKKFIKTTSNSNYQYFKIKMGMGLILNAKLKIIDKLWIRVKEDEISYQDGDFSSSTIASFSQNMENRNVNLMRMPKNKKRGNDICAKLVDAICLFRSRGYNHLVTDADLLHLSCHLKFKDRQYITNKYDSLLNLIKCHPTYFKVSKNGVILPVIDGNVEFECFTVLKKGQIFTIKKSNIFWSDEYDERNNGCFAVQENEVLYNEMHHSFTNFNSSMCTIQTDYPNAFFGVSSDGNAPLQNEHHYLDDRIESDFADVSRDVPSRNKRKCEQSYYIDKVGDKLLERQNGGLAPNMENIRNTTNKIHERVSASPNKFAKLVATSKTASMEQFSTLSKFSLHENVQSSIDEDILVEPNQSETSPDGPENIVDKRLECEAVLYLYSTIKEDSYKGKHHSIADPDLEDLLYNARPEVTTYIKYTYCSLAQFILFASGPNNYFRMKADSNGLIRHGRKKVIEQLWLSIKEDETRFENGEVYTMVDFPEFIRRPLQENEMEQRVLWKLRVVIRQYRARGYNHLVTYTDLLHLSCQLSTPEKEYVKNVYVSFLNLIQSHPDCFKVSKRGIILPVREGELELEYFTVSKKGNVFPVKRSKIVPPHCEENITEQQNTITYSDNELPHIAEENVSDDSDNSELSSWNSVSEKNKEPQNRTHKNISLSHRSKSGRKRKRDSLDVFECVDNHFHTDNEDQTEPQSCPFKNVLSRSKEKVEKWNRLSLTSQDIELKEIRNVHVPKRNLSGDLNKPEEFRMVFKDASCQTTFTGPIISATIFEAESHSGLNNSPSFRNSKRPSSSQSN